MSVMPSDSLLLPKAIAVFQMIEQQPDSGFLRWHWLCNSLIGQRAVAGELDDYAQVR